MSNGIGHVWAVNAEGGDEGRPNGVGPVWIENADQLGSKLPEPASADAGKVLGVLNSDGDIGWVPDQEGMAQVQADWDQDDPSEVSYIAHKPTIPTVDQVYSASSANAQSGVAVASAISGKQDTISDLDTIRSGAALGATSLQPSDLPTVDQTYNASSTNAQSGTAVAQAIAAIPSASYSAGDGIDINGSNVISVASDDTISSVYPLCNDVKSYLTNDQGQGYACFDSNNTQFPLGDVLNTVPEHGTLRVLCSAGRFYTVGTLSTSADNKAYVVVSSDTSFNGFAVYPKEIPVTYVQADNTWLIGDVDVTVPTVVSTANGWIGYGNPNYGSMRYIGIGFGESPSAVSTGTIGYGDPTILSNEVSLWYPNITANKVIGVTNPVPASAVGDAGKVLTVDNSGAPAWETPATVTVDQTYNSASTNAQSGVAVAQAIASVPSEVSSASGHFDIGGAVPVKVNYTGSSVTNSVRPTDATSSQVKFDIPGALDSLTVTVSENAYTNGTTAEYWYADDQNNKIQPVDGTYSAPSGMFDAQNQKINKKSIRVHTR